jgi:glycosyltransferase involved in cell wall biosynthesis
MPVVGRQQLFRRSLYSLLLQDHVDWELVVYDGDPKDPQEASASTRKVFELVGDRLRYEVGPNLGLFPGFNRCLRATTGSVLYCMGSDDQLGAGALSGVVARFRTERYPTNLWVYGKTVSADAVGRRWGVDGAPTDLEKMLWRNSLGLPSVFWARGLWELAGGFDPRYHLAADYELWLRYWRYREPAFLDQELGIYCHHDGQASRVYAAELEVEVGKIRQRHQGFSALITTARNRQAVGRAAQVSVN